MMGLTGKSIVGLELDSKEIRAVEIKGTAKKPVVTSWGKQSLREGIIRDGRVADEKALSEALETLWRESRIKTRDVIFGINSQDVIIRFASFPKVPEDRVRNMILYQAQDYIPVALEELQLDYVIVGEKRTDEGEVLQVILVGARKKSLHEYNQAFQGAKLNVTEIDSGLLAMGRAVLTEAKEKAYAVVGYTNDMANIMIFNKDVLSVARSVPFSQSSLWTNRKAGEEGADNEAEEAIIADILINELKSSVSYYKMQSSENIEGVYLLNQLKSKVITERLNAAVGFDVKLPDPYAFLDNNVVSKHKLDFKASSYIAPISLGLRGLGDK